jgi:HD-GYP domain-containing protein (c-di-GMP phosphodiesterase class II)
MMPKSRKKHLKKIAVEHLRPGMYLNEICGSWMDHPFWNTRFLITDPADLEKIRAAAIVEVWIDTARGADVAPAAAESEPVDAGDEDGSEVSIEALAAGGGVPVKVELGAEVARAAAICGQAKAAVTDMFREARMGKAVNADDLEPLVTEISASVMRNPGALVSLARLKDKDDYTYLHSVAVCGLMIALARQLNFDEAASREAGMAGLLHDLGKAAIPLEILNKPGKLTDGEFEKVKSHPVRGYEMLLEGGSVGEIPLDVCLHHHEKTSGRGYPDGLDASSLSLHAKMGAVCDVYDAITSDRPYKDGWDPSTAIRKMTEWQDGHFDETVFQAFVKAVGIYPVGSLVRLDSNMLGVVSEVSPESLLKPVVKTFYCTRRNVRQPPRIIDLTESDQRIIAWESPTNWNFPDLDELWSGIDRQQTRRAGAA